MAPLRVSSEPVRSFAALGELWRALEAEVRPSFFGSWTWVGCLAEERYPDPVLLRAERDGRLVGLALFNRHGGRLHLAESGDAERDRPFTEHNGPLAADPAAAAALVSAAWEVRGTRRILLGGVPPELVRSVRGAPLRLQLREAPFLDLDALRAAGGDLAGLLSANTRYQLRRSHRHYTTGGAAPRLERAASEAERDAWFEALAALHAASWRRRGQDGAFATDFLRRFHRTLVARAWARDELDLLRIAAGPEAVGFLYNFRLRGRVYAYQSGLDEARAGPHGKPGLTCHSLAIAHALARGDRIYDFLAGDQRYKRSLSRGSATLAWAELVPRWSAFGIAARLLGRGRAIA